jgi:hypothetical protein
MVALQFGSMPHAQANKNIELFGREVLHAPAEPGKTSRGRTIGGQRLRSVPRQREMAC